MSTALSLLLLLTLACRTPEDTAPPADTGPFDLDGDGHYAADDCDDGDPTVFPGATELCNDSDDDCDGDIDEDVLLEFWPDTDDDGWGDQDAAVHACQPPSGHVEPGEDGDCDDGDATVHPEAEEACNDTDDDCDGETDEGVLLDWWTDADSDGWGDETSVTQACEIPSGHVEPGEWSDCDDGDATVHPEAEELCNGTDDDCDGQTDEEVLLDFWADIDGDGWGNPDYHSQGCEAEVGMVDNADDCDDLDPTIHPDAEEACNEVDDDCDGSVDEDC